MSPLVSVIVPVYNVMPYLEECVKSIVSQTFIDFECILVDDGSTDGSSGLCDDLASQDTRINVIHKENGGLSDARNTGLQKAAGYYLLFIDSDDYWRDKNVLKELVLLFKKQDDDCDFINFNRTTFYQKKNKLELWPDYPSVTNLPSVTKKEKIAALIENGLFHMSACTKIIKRDFLLKNNITFIKGIVTEDVPWFLELIDKSRNFIFINERYYIYRKDNPNSITVSFSEKKYFDCWFVLRTEIKKIMDKDYDKELKEALLSFMAYEYCIIMGNIYYFPFKKRTEEIKKFKEYEWLLRYKLHPKVKKVWFLWRFTNIKIVSFILYVLIINRRRK